ncbi:MAG: tripartite tricarboxylate transporter substrate binding protein [Ottowia sp.]|uniref:Bug family tripartite tricarboxylate transporter substrate binding protein n=1 Tax=unclassified Ottowia TaxID=2645081 RepID=UPI003C30BC47
MNTAPFPRRRWLAAAALALASASPLAWAQVDYPNKPVKIVVNFPPGGAADQIARAISQPLQEALHQPVVVENRGGANGNIGADYVAKAPADGYTLLMSSGGTISINPHLYAKMPFDPAKDLVPVVSAGRILVYLEVHPKVPVNSAREFIQYVKANPGKLSFGSPGTGSSPHLAAELFKQQAGVFALHVPYRGGGPAIQDLLAGQLDFMFDPGVGLQHVKAGKLKLLAIGSSQRSPEFPNVPTMEEVGLKGFDADTWFGFYAPGGTPPAVIAKLNAEIGKIVRTPAFATRMTAIGGIPAALSPQEFAAKGHEDSDRFGALIRTRGIKAE